MLTNQEIENLIICPKKIIDSLPKKGMVADIKSPIIQRKNLDLISLEGKYQFKIFIRQNTLLIEQFSLGLQYKTDDKTFGDITLIRFNGNHGMRDWSKDGHYNAFHIHKITEKLLKKGILEPKSIKITDLYNTFESAIYMFLKHINIVNSSQYFPTIDAQMSIFKRN